MFLETTPLEKQSFVQKADFTKSKPWIVLTYEQLGDVSFGEDTRGGLC
jgi:hypothetical protein